MNLIHFLQELTSKLNCIAENECTEKRSLVCFQCNELIRNYLQNETENEQKCKALTQCLLFYTAIRPLCDFRDISADSLGHAIFMECASLVLGVWYQHDSEETAAVKAVFKSSVEESFAKLQHFLIGHVFLVLQWLLVNGWTHPTLLAMMNGSQLEEETAIQFIENGEFPEILRLRVELLVSQQCEDLALNLCSCYIRSSIFERDVGIRKTQLQLLYKQGHEDFHVTCLQVPCCLLPEIVNSLEADLEVNTSLAVSQTALIHRILSPEIQHDSCFKKISEHWLRLEQARHGTDEEQFLNSVHKIFQLTSTHEQKRLLLMCLLDTFESRYLNFIAEIAVSILKRDRFTLDAAKIARQETEAQVATSGLIEDCRLLERMFRGHYQMCLEANMSLCYLDPSTELFFSLQSSLQNLPSQCSQQEPVGPSTVDEEVYKEMYCVVGMLRPAHFQTQRGWKHLGLTLTLHMLESGFKFDAKAATFVKTKTGSNKESFLSVADSKGGCNENKINNNTTIGHSSFNNPAVDSYTESKPHGESFEVTNQTREGNSSLNVVAVDSSTVIKPRSESYEVTVNKNTREGTSSLNHDKVDSSIMIKPSCTVTKPRSESYEVTVTKNTREGTSSLDDVTLDSCRSNVFTPRSENLENTVNKITREGPSSQDDPSVESYTVSKPRNESLENVNSSGNELKPETAIDNTFGKTSGVEIGKREQSRPLPHAGNSLFALDSTQEGTVRTPSITRTGNERCVLNIPQSERMDVLKERERTVHAKSLTCYDTYVSNVPQSVSHDNTSSSDLSGNGSSVLNAPQSERTDISNDNQSSSDVSANGSCELMDVSNDNQSSSNLNGNGSSALHTPHSEGTDVLNVNKSSSSLGGNRSRVCDAYHSEHTEGLNADESLGCAIGTPIFERDVKTEALSLGHNENGATSVNIAISSGHANVETSATLNQANGGLCSVNEVNVNESSKHVNRVTNTSLLQVQSILCCEKPPTVICEHSEGVNIETVSSGGDMNCVSPLPNYYDQSKSPELISSLKDEVHQDNLLLEKEKDLIESSMVCLKSDDNEDDNNDLVKTFKDASGQPNTLTTHSQLQRPNANTSPQCASSEHINAISHTHCSSEVQSTTCLLNNTANTELQRKQTQTVAKEKPQVRGNQETNREKVETNHGQVETIREANHGQVETIRVIVETNRGKVETILGKVETNHGQVETIRGKVETNRGNVEAIRGKVETNHGQVETIRGKVESNHGKVESNHGKVATNRGKVEANRGKVEAKCGKVEAKRGKVEANRGKVEANRGKVEANQVSLLKDLNNAVKDLLLHLKPPHELTHCQRDIRDSSNQISNKDLATQNNKGSKKSENRVGFLSNLHGRFSKGPQNTFGVEKQSQNDHEETEKCTQEKATDMCEAGGEVITHKIPQMTAQHLSVDSRDDLTSDSIDTCVNPDAKNYGNSSTVLMNKLDTDNNQPLCGKGFKPKTPILERFERKLAEDSKQFNKRRVPSCVENDVDFLQTSQKLQRNLFADLTSTPQASTVLSNVVQLEENSSNFQGNTPELNRIPDKAIVAFAENGSSYFIASKTLTNVQISQLTKHTSVVRLKQINGNLRRNGLQKNKAFKTREKVAKNKKNSTSHRSLFERFTQCEKDAEISDRLVIKDDESVTHMGKAYTHIDICHKPGTQSDRSVTHSHRTIIEKDQTQTHCDQSSIHCDQSCTHCDRSVNHCDRTTNYVDDSLNHCDNLSTRCDNYSTQIDTALTHCDHAQTHCDRAHKHCDKPHTHCDSSVTHNEPHCNKTHTLCDLLKTHCDQSITQTDYPRTQSNQSLIHEERNAQKDDQQHSTIDVLEKAQNHRCFNTTTMLNISNQDSCQPSTSAEILNKQQNDRPLSTTDVLNSSQTPRAFNTATVLNKETNQQPFSPADAVYTEENHHGNPLSTVLNKTQKTQPTFSPAEVGITEENRDANPLSTVLNKTQKSQPSFSPTAVGNIKPAAVVNTEENHYANNPLSPVKSPLRIVRCNEARCPSAVNRAIRRTRRAVRHLARRQLCSPLRRVLCSRHLVVEARKLAAQKVQRLPDLASPLCSSRLVSPGVEGNDPRPDDVIVTAPLMSNETAAEKKLKTAGKMATHTESATTGLKSSLESLFGLEASCDTHMRARLQQICKSLKESQRFPHVSNQLDTVLDLCSKLDKETKELTKNYGTKFSENNKGETMVQSQSTDNITVDQTQPTNDLTKDQIQPTNDLTEDQSQPTNDLTEDQSQPNNDLTGDQSQPTDDLAEDQSQPTDDLTEDLSQPINDLTEDQSQPTNDLTGYQSQPTNDLADDQSQPTQDLTEVQSQPTDYLTEDQSQPTDDLTEDQSQPTQDLTEDQSQPTQDLTEDQSQPTQDLIAQSNSHPENSNLTNECNCERHANEITHEIDQTQSNSQTGHLVLTVEYNNDSYELAHEIDQTLSGLHSEHIAAYSQQVNEIHHDNDLTQSGLHTKKYELTRETSDHFQQANELTHERSDRVLSNWHPKDFALSREISDDSQPVSVVKEVICTENKPCFDLSETWETSPEEKENICQHNEPCIELDIETQLPKCRANSEPHLPNRPPVIEDICTLSDSSFEIAETPGEATSPGVRESITKDLVKETFSAESKPAIGVGQASQTRLKLDESISSHDESSNGVAENESSNGVAENESSNGVADNESSNGVAENESSNGVADYESSNGVADNESSNGVAENESSNGVAGNESSNGAADNESSNGAAENESSNGAADNESSNGVAEVSVSVEVKENNFTDSKRHFEIAKVKENMDTLAEHSFELQRPTSKLVDENAGTDNDSSFGKCKTKVSNSQDSISTKNEHPELNSPAVKATICTEKEPSFGIGKPEVSSNPVVKETIWSENEPSIGIGKPHELNSQVVKETICSENEPSLDIDKHKVSCGPMGNETICTENEPSSDIDKPRELNDPAVKVTICTKNEHYFDIGKSLISNSPESICIENEPSCDIGKSYISSNPVVKDTICTENEHSCDMDKPQKSNSPVVIETTENDPSFGLCKAKGPDCPTASKFHQPGFCTREKYSALPDTTVIDMVMKISSSGNERSALTNPVDEDKEKILMCWLLHNLPYCQPDDLELDALALTSGLPKHTVSMWLDLTITRYLRVVGSFLVDNEIRRTYSPRKTLCGKLRVKDFKEGLRRVGSWPELDCRLQVYRKLPNPERQELLLALEQDDKHEKNTSVPVLCTPERPERLSKLPPSDTNSILSPPPTLTPQWPVHSPNANCKHQSPPLLEARTDKEKENERKALQQLRNSPVIKLKRINSDSLQSVKKALRYGKEGGSGRKDTSVMCDFEDRQGIIAKSGEKDSSNNESSSLSLIENDHQGVTAKSEKIHNRNNENLSLSLIGKDRQAIHSRDTLESVEEEDKDIRNINSPLSLPLIEDQDVTKEESFHGSLQHRRQSGESRLSREDVAAKILQDICWNNANFSNVTITRLQNYFVETERFSPLRCRFCGLEYDSLLLRRRHEEFYCPQNSSDGRPEKTSTELLALVTKRLEQAKTFEKIEEEERAQLKTRRQRKEAIKERLKELSLHRTCGPRMLTEKRKSVDKSLCRYCGLQCSSATERSAHLRSCLKLMERITKKMHKEKRNRSPSVDIKFGTTGASKDNFIEFNACSVDLIKLASSTTVDTSAPGGHFKKQLDQNNQIDYHCASDGHFKKLDKTNQAHVSASGVDLSELQQETVTDSRESLVTKETGSQSLITKETTGSQSLVTKETTGSQSLVTKETTGNQSHVTKETTGSQSLVTKETTGSQSIATKETTGSQSLVTRETTGSQSPVTKETGSQSLFAKETGSQSRKRRSRVACTYCGRRMSKFKLIVRHLGKCPDRKMKLAKNESTNSLATEESLGHGVGIGTTSEARNENRRCAVEAVKENHTATKICSTNDETSNGSNVATSLSTDAKPISSVKKSSDLGSEKSENCLKDALAFKADNFREKFKNIVIPKLSKKKPMERVLSNDSNSSSTLSRVYESDRNRSHSHKRWHSKHRSQDDHHNQHSGEHSSDRNHKRNNRYQSEIKGYSFDNDRYKDNDRCGRDRKGALRYDEHRHRKSYCGEKRSPNENRSTTPRFNSETESDIQPKRSRLVSKESEPPSFTWFDGEGNRACRNKRSGSFSKRPRLKYKQPESYSFTTCRQFSNEDRLSFDWQLHSNETNRLRIPNGNEYGKQLNTQFIPPTTTDYQDNLAKLSICSTTSERAMQLSTAFVPSDTGTDSYPKTNTGKRSHSESSISGYSRNELAMNTHPNTDAIRNMQNRDYVVHNYFDTEQQYGVSEHSRNVSAMNTYSNTDIGNRRGNREYLEHNRYGSQQESFISPPEIQRTIMSQPNSEWGWSGAHQLEPHYGTNIRNYEMIHPLAPQNQPNASDSCNSTPFTGQDMTQNPYEKLVNKPVTEEKDQTDTANIDTPDDKAIIGSKLHSMNEPKNSNATDFPRVKILSTASGDFPNTTATNFPGAKYPATSIGDFTSPTVVKQKRAADTGVALATKETLECVKRALEFLANKKSKTPTKPTASVTKSIASVTQSTASVTKPTASVTKPTATVTKPTASLTKPTAKYRKTNMENGSIFKADTQMAKVLVKEGNIENSLIPKADVQMHKVPVTNGNIENNSILKADTQMLKVPEKDGNKENSSMYRKVIQRVKTSKNGDNNVGTQKPTTEKTLGHKVETNSYDIFLNYAREYNLLTTPEKEYKNTKGNPCSTFLQYAKGYNVAGKSPGVAQNSYDVFLKYAKQYNLLESPDKLSTASTSKISTASTSNTNTSVVHSTISTHKTLPSTFYNSEPHNHNLMSNQDHTTWDSRVIATQPRASNEVDLSLNDRLENSGKESIGLDATIVQQFPQIACEEIATESIPVLTSNSNSVTSTAYSNEIGLASVRSNGVSNVPFYTFEPTSYSNSFTPNAYNGDIGIATHTPIDEYNNPTYTSEHLDFVYEESCAPTYMSEAMGESVYPESSDAFYNYAKFVVNGIQNEELTDDMYEYNDQQIYTNDGYNSGNFECVSPPRKPRTHCTTSIKTSPKKKIPKPCLKRKAPSQDNRTEDNKDKSSKDKCRTEDKIDRKSSFSASSLCIGVSTSGSSLKESTQHRKESTQSTQYREKRVKSSTASLHPTDKGNCEDNKIQMDNTTRDTDRKPSLSISSEDNRIHVDSKTGRKDRKPFLSNTASCDGRSTPSSTMPEGVEGSDNKEEQIGNALTSEQEPLDKYDVENNVNEKAYKHVPQLRAIIQGIEERIRQSNKPTNSRGQSRMGFLGKGAGQSYCSRNFGMKTTRGFSDARVDNEMQFKGPFRSDMYNPLPSKHGKEIPLILRQNSVSFPTTNKDFSDKPNLLAKTNIYQQDNVDATIYSDPSLISSNAEKASNVSNWESTEDGIFYSEQAVVNTSTRNSRKLEQSNPASFLPRSLTLSATSPTKSTKVVVNNDALPKDILTLLGSDLDEKS